MITETHPSTDYYSVDDLRDKTVAELRKIGYKLSKNGTISEGTSEIAHMRKDQLKRLIHNRPKPSSDSDSTPSATEQDGAKTDAKTDSESSKPSATEKDEKAEIKEALEELRKKLGLTDEEEDVSISVNVEGQQFNDITIPKGKVSHHLLERIIRKALRHRNVMLVGPAGTGKTTLAQNVAEALNTAFGHISCTAGMSEGHLLGRMLMDGRYISTPFIEIAENGGVFLADEFDASDPNMLVVWNSFLANGILSVPNNTEKPTLKRHEGCFFLACCNTYGTGNGSWEYTGRNQLDQATLDRFALSTIYVDYDDRLEELILTGNKKRAKKPKIYSHDGSEKAIEKNLVALGNSLKKLRKEVAKNRLRRVVSTRLFAEGRKAVIDGDSVKQVLNDMTVSWQKNEKDKVMLTDIIAKAQSEINPQSKGAK